MKRTLELDLIDNGDIPVYDADGLYDAEVIGNSSWFLLFHIRRRANGERYREPAFYVRMPNAAVGPSVALTICKVGEVLDTSVTGAAVEIAKGLLVQ